MIQWQDSASAELVNELKQVHDDLTAGLEGLSWRDQYDRMMQHMQARPVHAAFHELHLTLHIRDHVAWANAGRATGKNAEKLWTMPHLEDGFGGCQLPQAAASMTPLSQKAFLYMIASTFWMAHQSGVATDEHLPFATREVPPPGTAASSSGQ